MENTKNVTDGATGNLEAWDSGIDTSGTESLDALGGVSNNTESTTGQAPFSANRPFDKFSERATQAKAMFSEKFDQMKGQQGKWADDARVRVRENPMMAMGIAVAAGFLLRRLLSRPRR